jgi:protein Mpv17
MTQLVSSRMICLVGDFVAQSIGPRVEVVEGVKAGAEKEMGWVQALAEE